MSLTQLYSLMRTMSKREIMSIDNKCGAPSSSERGSSNVIANLSCLLHLILDLRLLDLLNLSESLAASCCMSQHLCGSLGKALLLLWCHLARPESVHASSKCSFNDIVVHPACWADGERRKAGVLRKQLHA